MNELNLNKTIFKTALITFCSILFVFVLIIGSLTCFYPVSLARFTSSIGLDKLSVFYYELTYKKSENINDLYNLLNKTITIEDNAKIISNFETLYDNGSLNYYNFINYINDFYLNTTNDFNLKLFLFNEDSRLKSRYVSALFNTEEKEQAFYFAVEDLQNESFLNINNYQNLNFIMSEYINLLIDNNATLEEYSIFENYTNEEYENFNFLETAITYYDTVKDAYEISLFLNEGTENNFKLCVIANHLFRVANDLLYLDTKLNNAIDTSLLENDIQNYLLQIEELTEDYLLEE